MLIVVRRFSNYIIEECLAGARCFSFSITKERLVRCFSSSIYEGCMGVAWHFSTSIA